MWRSRRKRVELIKVVKKLWEEDKRSVTEGFKLPLEKYLHSMRNVIIPKPTRESNKHSKEKGG